MSCLIYTESREHYIPCLQYRECHHFTLNIDSAMVLVYTQSRELNTIHLHSTH